MITHVCSSAECRSAPFTYTFLILKYANVDSNSGVALGAFRYTPDENKQTHQRKFTVIYTLYEQTYIM